MGYVEGFVAAVPAANREAYRRHAAEAAPLFKAFGVRRLMEAWGDDVPEGRVTDFRQAVKAEPDESIVFGWFEYADKATRDGAVEKMMSDPRMERMGDAMPFDAKRMIFGGFATFLDEGETGRTGYVDGSLVAVPNAARDAFRDQMARQTAIMREHGAARILDAWGDDVPEGKVTDYRRAVKATADETVVFS